MPLDLPSIRRQFPILQSQVEGHPLTYLDSAASAEKPQVVLDAMDAFYTEDYANVHRGMHVLAERATVAYEDARTTIQKFIGARSSEEVIITKGTTESINMVAKTWGRANLQEGDAVVLTMLEHHSNVVPWLQLKSDMGIDVLWVDINDDGSLKMDQLDAFLARGNVKLVAITSQSNVLGTRPPLKEIIQKSYAAGALVLVDAAQSVSHSKTDVADLDCDFFAFSGHKLYGPTGIGILYGKKSLLESMPTFLGGGNMIHEVHQDHFTPADLPAKFEAGTPPIAEAIGLSAAIKWLSEYSWKEIEEHESKLLKLAYDELSTIDNIRILGSKESVGCFSFVIANTHPHDLTEILGREGICLRAGHHCTQPLHKRLGITASTRISVGIYNNEEDIRALKPAIERAIQKLS